jgi:hypothetical protein
MTKTRRNITFALAALLVLMLADLLAGPRSSEEEAERQSFLAKLGSGYWFNAPPSDYLVHPQWGWVLNPKPPNINNQGFPGGVPSYPYRKDSNEFVVGVFGGGAALDLAGEKNTLLDRFRQMLRQRGYEELTIIPFALNGWRAPQGYLALISALSSVDMAIVVDGFNEVNLLRDEDLRQHPASFPWMSVFGMLARGSTEEDVMRRAQTFQTIHAAQAMTKRFASAPLKWSSLAHQYWRWRAARYLSEVTALRLQEIRLSDAAWSGFDPATSNAELERNSDEYLGYWADLIRYSQWLCQHKHKPFFHFVQPNLHVEGSKPFSAEERKMIARTQVPGVFSYEHITPLYRRLERITTSLKEEGINTTFLGNLFRKETETLYRDDCCGINGKGMRIIAGAIADRIAASGELERIPILRQPKTVR